VPTYFDAVAFERAELWRAVDEVKDLLDGEFQPHGYNVGFNVGRSAGQTVDHLHVHVIPRYVGDMDDPRGGVRGVIPHKQNYLVSTGAQLRSSEVSPASATLPSADGPFAALPPFVPGEERPFVEPLLAALRVADRADLLAAFVQPSGLRMLGGEIEDALQRGTQVRVLTGDYSNITSADALRVLLRLSEHAGMQASFFEVDKAVAETFHAKSYIFRKGESTVAYIGSSNLTKAALAGSVEWNLRLVSSQDERTLAEICARFDRLWSDERTKPLTKGLIDAYEARAPVPEAPEQRQGAPEPHNIQQLALASVFG
jgi:HKD family nuclease